MCAPWFSSSHDASGSLQIPLDLQVLGVEFSSLTNRPPAVCYVCEMNCILRISVCLRKILDIMDLGMFVCLF